MRHFCGVFTSIVLFASTNAAPLPKDLKGSKLELLFGKKTDPSESCEFSLDGDKLRVVIPAKVDVSATALKGTPRTSREVEGDFVAEAVVSYLPPKNEDGKATGHLGAGIAAWVDEQNYAFINRHHWPAGAGWAGGFDTHIHLPEVTPVSHGATCEGTGPEITGRLRLSRVGNEFTTAESRDNGKTWNQTGKIEGTLPQKLQVGVVAINATKMKVEIIFDSFEVTQKK